MGLLDSFEGMASEAMGGGNDQGRVAGGLVQAIQEQPGGLGAVLSNLRNNGLGGHADAIQNGEAPPMTPDHVETGLQGTGILENVAMRAGVSPAVAKVALAAILPVVLAHFSQNGGQPSASSLGGLLSKFI